eukprot:8191773-Karenia_brevis.AAC.1
MEKRLLRYPATESKQERRQIHLRLSGIESGSQLKDSSSASPSISGLSMGFPIKQYQELSIRMVEDFSSDQLHRDEKCRACKCAASGRCGKPDGSMCQDASHRAQITSS